MGECKCFCLGGGGGCTKAKTLDMEAIAYNNLYLTGITCFDIWVTNHVHIHILALFV